MFSMAFYKNELGEDMEIFSEDIKKIESILDETLVDQKNGDHIELAEIQKIFEKYLRNVSIQVKPLIVEDILLRKGVSGEEYVRKIKSDKLVEQARANERTGIKDLIHGHYRVK